MTVPQDFPQGLASQNGHSHRPVLTPQQQQQQPVVVETVFDYLTKLEPAVNTKDHTIDVSLDVFKHFWGEDQSDNTKMARYAAVRYLGSNKLTEFQIFKVGRVSSALGKGSIKVFENGFVSEDITVSKAVVYSINPVFLDHLVISVSNETLFQQLQDKSFGPSYSELFQFWEQDGNLVRTNDKIKITGSNHWGKVILTEPVSQGLLDSNTKVTIVYNENKTDEIHDSIDNRNDDDLVSKVSSEFFDINEYLADALGSSSLANRVGNAEPKSRDPEKRELGQTNSLSLELQILPAPISDFNPSPDPKEDPEIFAFTSFKNLVSIGCFSGDYVTIRIPIRAESSQYIHKKVKAFAFIEPSTFAVNSLYISPIFYINLGSPTGEIIISKSIDATPNTGAESSFESQYKLAKQVTIARIASPLSLNRTYQQISLLNLKDFFQQHLRVVSRNTVVPVPIDALLAKSVFSAYGDSDYPPMIPRGDPNEVIWFMITDIAPDDEDQSSIGEDSIGSDQYLINPLKTKMIQSGLIKDFKILEISDPVNWYGYLGLKPFFKFSLVISLVIQRETAKSQQVTAASVKAFRFAEKLKNLISTSILNDDFNISTCILLHSLTRNVGKSTLARNLALELGINFLELDAYDLILSPGSDMKVIGSIRGKLDSAVKNCQAPLLIFFKHLEILVAGSGDGNGGSNGGSDGGAGGAEGGGASGSSRKSTFNVKLTETINSYFQINKKVIFIASTNNINKISTDLRNLFSFTVEVTVPNEIERQEIFKFYLNSINNLDPYLSSKELIQLYRSKKYKYRISKEVSVDSLSLQSAGLNPIDIVSIVKCAKNLALDRINESSQTTLPLDRVLSNGGYISLLSEDFETSINNARNTFSESIGAPKIPNVRWEDVGGLDIVKDEILDTIELPLKNPYLFSNGLKKRSGILFYGPPGTGKTLLAKAIATNFSLNFFSVKGPELLNMYIGESEANVRKVFQKARDAKPCVVFFDELDSVAPKRGNQGDSGGVMDRIVSQLLSELDGMSDGDDGDGVFVVGATNRPDLLDEALLRPGRFDKMLYLGISDTHEKQLKILKALTRKFKFDEDIDLKKLLETFSFNYTGADFYALSSDAMLNAMTRKAHETDAKIKSYNDMLPRGQKKVNTRWWFDNIATKEDVEVLVKQEDFEKARNELVPSVSAEELHHYLRVRDNFEGGKKKANGSKNTVDGDMTDSHPRNLDRLHPSEVYGSTVFSTTTDDDTDLYDDAVGSLDASINGEYVSEEGAGDDASSVSTISHKGKGKEKLS